MRSSGEIGWARSRCRSRNMVWSMRERETRI